MNSNDQSQRFTKKGWEKLGEILDSAQKFFIENDSEGFTTTELAKSLNMTQANLYHYIQSKRELWFALGLRSQYEIRDGLTEIVEQNIANFDKLLLMVRFYLNYVKNNPEKIYLQYRTSPPPPGKEKGPFELQEMKKFNNANLIILKDVLAEGVNNGEFQPHLDPDQKVFFYWSLIFGSTNFFIIGFLYDCIKKKGSIDYKTLKKIEGYERNIIQIIEEDLSKYLISEQ